MKTKHYRELLLVAVFTLLIFCAHAQPPDWLWAESIGGANGNDHANSIATDKNGNVYTVGNFHGTVDFDPGPGVYNLNSTGSNDVFISKLDSSGSFVWAKEIIGSGLINGTNVKIDSLMNIYVSGYFIGIADFDPDTSSFNINSNNSYSTYFMKFNSLGNMLWTKEIGGSVGFNEIGRDALSMALDDQGNICLTGSFTGTIDFNPDSINVFSLTSVSNDEIFISKYDNSGNLIWAESTTGTGSGFARSLVVDRLGNIFITGNFSNSMDFDPSVSGVHTLNANGVRDMFILKLDSSGQFIWTKTIGGANDDNGNSIAIDALCNIFITGFFTDTVDFDPDTTGVFFLPVFNSNAENFITKMDSSGKLIWAKELGTFASGKGSYIALDRKANIYISAVFDSTSDLDPGPGTTNLIDHGQGDICITRLDSSGNFVWVKQIGGEKIDVIECPVVIDNSFSVYLAGRFSSDTISSDSVLLANSDQGGYSDIFIARLDSQKIALNIKKSEPISESIIYPNPVFRNFTIDLNRSYKEIEITILDITGKVIYTVSERGVNKIDISIDAMINRIYLVQIKSDDFVETKKIIVSN